MNNPLVSIIIPTFNRAHLIGETLDSIIAQTYTNWECIVVDDGSTDNTEEVVSAYVQKDSRFQFHHRPDTHKPGGNGARNYGLEISKGEYINFFDSDDLMHPEKLNKQLISLIEDVKVDFCICQTISFNSESKEVISNWNSELFSNDPLNDFIYKKIGWSILAPIWKKASLIKYNIKFDEELKNGQDFKFHIEALLNGFKPVIIDEVLVYNREHANQIKSKGNKAFSKSIIFKFLYENKKQLNSNTVVYVQKTLVNLIPRLYLDKNYYKAKEISFFVIKNFLTFKTFFIIFYYTTFGYFYKYTNKGYRFLRINYKD